MGWACAHRNAELPVSRAGLLIGPRLCDEDPTFHFLSLRLHRMKATAFVPAAALLMTAVSAQVDNNLVDRNNRAYLVISTTSHPTTTRPYLWSPMNPIEFAPAVLGGTGGTTGVPAGTETWRHIVGATNRRSSTRAHTGWSLGMATSAASTAFPNTTAYMPRLSIWKGKLNGAGPGYVPDFASAPLVQTAQASYTFSNAGFYRVTVNLTTATTFSGDDLCLSLQWKGGEGDDLPGTQGFWSDYSAGVLTSAPTQFAFPYGFSRSNNTAIQLGTTDFSDPFLQYAEDESSICLFASWGAAGNIGTYPLLYGSSLHSVNSNLSTTAGYFGYDIAGGSSQSGGYAVFLLNVAGAPFPGSFNLLGQTLELNIADPGLNALADAGYVLTLDPQGAVKGPQIPLPASPNLAGVWVGAEAAIIAANLSQVNETTQAAWFRIN